MSVRNAADLIREQKMELADQISKGILLLYLCAAAVLDVRTKELPLLFLAAGGACAIAMQLLSGELTVLQMLCGAIPGLGLLLAARITRQAVGYGDGALLLIPGLFLGLLPTVLLLLCALLIAAGTGIFLMAVKRWKKKQELPFVPFLYAGYILVLLLI